MRYKIKGVEIRSENAAKPSSQKSSAVNDYIGTLSNAPLILDFGCGKLRYSDTLVSVASKVTFVDSDIQLNREQVIRGERTTVKQYVKSNYSGCKTIPYENLEKHRSKYDVITCTNVLSAIPCKKTISEVMAHISSLLKKDGFATFVNQHRSSYFKKYESGERMLHGYLYSGSKGSSYYGILDKAAIERLLKKHGYEIIKTWIVGESTFTEARPNS
ncbi:class I SAM-dependent methyltransferase [Neptuniibacter sp. 2_MG-2023]|uniref:class I SAM-dependent methyltransferase n=1 Tax=Neptuniibacter sp. 2_MG-2023 TaxID=3062671 RepID=UPI0026E20DB6|nr:class I SAM-dependent methyltransferase [Neptuniibacter sp. 2_MG-2023]MDO6512714.1 class I SAM-dependent methyltransferase [Neptuniibacter sp. 2_MG-2023]